MRIAVALRLGCNLVQSHKCVCGAQVQSNGLHGHRCKESAGRHSRHHALNEILNRAFSSANVPSLLEPCVLSRDDGKRPDGMTLVPWSRGQALVWDATCVDTLADSYVVSTARKAGAAAEAAALVKHNHYIEIAQNYEMIAFAVETLGPWSAEAKSLCKDLGSRLIEVSGEARAGAYLSQRISLAIQRANALSVLGTFPGSVGTETTVKFKDGNPTRYCVLRGLDNIGK